MIYFCIYKLLFVCFLECSKQEKGGLYLQKVEGDNLRFREHKGTTHYEIERLRLQKTTVKSWYLNGFQVC